MLYLCVVMCAIPPHVCCLGLVFVPRVHGVFYVLMFAVWSVCVCVCVARVCGCGVCVLDLLWLCV